MIHPGATARENALKNMREAFDERFPEIASMTDDEFIARFDLAEQLECLAKFYQCMQDGMDRMNAAMADSAG